MKVRAQAGGAPLSVFDVAGLYKGVSTPLVTVTVPLATPEPSPDLTSTAPLAPLPPAPEVSVTAPPVVEP